jgi:hypothetical protein
MVVQELLRTERSDRFVFDVGGVILPARASTSSASSGGKKLPGRIEQFESIPLGRIVRGGQNDTSRGFRLDNRHLHGGRGGHAGIDDITATRLHRRDGERRAYSSGRTPITAYDYESAGSRLSDTATTHVP